MRKAYKYIAACAALAGLVGCAKIEVVPVVKAAAEVVEEEGGDYVVNFECTVDGTKTGFDDGTGIEWKSGDGISFFQVRYASESASSTTYQKVDKTIENDGDEANFSCSFNAPYIVENEKAVRYFAVYPTDKYVGAIGLGEKKLPKMTLSGSQTPAVGSFDPKADILLGEYNTLYEAKTSLELRFQRYNAIGKMKLTNLPSTNEIKSVSFSAVKSGNAVALAGSTYYNPNSENVYEQYSYTTSTTAANNTSTEYTITLDYSSQNLTANSSEGTTAHFCCYPFKLDEGDTFTVVVTTKAGEVITKVVTIPDTLTDGFKFESGKGTQFTVNMSTATKTCDWCEIVVSDTTINGAKCTFSTTADDVTSVKVACAASFSNLYTTYFDSKGTSKTLTDGSCSSSYNSLTIDTEYIYAVKIESASKGTVVLTKPFRTDWFKLAAAKSETTGKVQLQFYAVNLGSSTRGFRLISTSEAEGLDDLESFYLNTLKPGLLQETYVNGINDKKGAVYAFSTSSNCYDKDGKSVSSLTSETSYTVMIQATNTRGESVFRTATAKAK